MRKFFAKINEIVLQRRFGIIVGAILGALVGLLLSLRVGNGLADRSFDIPFRFRNVVAPPEAMIVFMDDASHGLLNQDPLEPWARGLHAKLLERLTKAGAKVIVFDVLFGESTNPPAGTAELAAAIRKSKVVLTSQKTPSEDPQLAGFVQELPAKEFRDAGATWGLSNVEQSGRVCREFFVGTPDNPALAWVAAQAANAPVAKDEKNLQRRYWLNFYGPAGSIPNVSYAASLGEMQPERFANKTVFIGAKPSAGFQGSKLEQFATPYDGETPGVEIHATAFLNILRGDSLFRINPTLEWVILIFGGALLGALLVLFRPGGAAVIAILGSCIVTAVGIVMPWKTHYWFNWAAIAAVQVPLAFIWSITYNSIKLHIEKMVIERSLRLHVSERRVQQLMGKPELLKPGAEKLEIAIMFTDIANFSKTTERMDSGDLFGMMNNYFQVALTRIHETDGTVIKLIGDAIFAIWNAPFPQPDHCVRAAKAALALQESVRQLEQDKRFLPLRTRVGLHVGEAHVGNVGSTDRFDYTAMGDNINLASRLEGLNKIVGTEILATRAFQKLIEGEVTTRLIGHFRFKGRERTVEVHEILHPSALKTFTASALEHFRMGLFHFQRAAWDEAQAGFEKAAQQNPEDPAKFYQGMIALLRERQKQKKLRDDWEGEIELEEK